MANPVHLSPPQAGDSTQHLDPPAGPRKLVRPQLPQSGSTNASRPARRAPPVLLAHQQAAPALSGPTASHAELFYFQKQMQAQTPLVFVLEDGERIEGVIEWYDQNVIKVRHTTRTMIYKSCIKYLFKAGEPEDRRHGGPG